MGIGDQTIQFAGKMGSASWKKVSTVVASAGLALRGKMIRGEVDTLS